MSLSDVLVESETSWGGYVLEGGMEVSYGFDFFLSMEVGKRYDITGQIRYAYGAYQLLPRFLEDLLLVGEGPGDDPGARPIQSLIRQRSARSLNSSKDPRAYCAPTAPTSSPSQRACRSKASPWGAEVCMTP